MNNNTIDGALLFAQNAISNALHQPVLKPYFDEYGYTQEKLRKGETLYKKADLSHKIQKKEYGDQYAATDDLHVIKANAGKMYKKHLKVARIALDNDPGPANALQLTGDRKRTLSGWISQAKAFYANSIKDPVVLEALGKYNITRKKPQAGQELVLECEVKYNMQLKEKGEAQSATKKRENAVDELDAWMSKFIAIARISS